MDSEILDAALQYAAFGWRVVPVDRATKHPPFRKWQELATTNVEQIEEWWERWPDANVGIQFGPSSGIIDIETDSDVGEKNLLALFGGDPPVTATFVSGSGRGKHRLFLYTNDLPDKANWAWDGVDFKLGYGDKGSQSAFPPSIHSSGGKYLWLPGLGCGECEIATLPDVAIATLCNLCGSPPPDGSGKPRRSADHWNRIVEGVAEGSRHKDILSFVGKTVSQFRDITSKDCVSLIVESVRAVNERFSPPLPDEELRRAVIDVIKLERQRRASEDFKSASSPTPEGAIRAMDNDTRFHLVIIEGEPSRYRLYGDEFFRAGGYLSFNSASELMSGHTVRLKALEQAQYALPATFAKAWVKKGGLFETLVNTAQRIAGDPLEDRTAIVAQSVYGRVMERVRQAKDGENAASGRGQPIMDADGSVSFGASWIRTELQYDPEKPTRNEIYKVLIMAGATQSRIRSHGARPHYWDLESGSLEKLRLIAYPTPPKPPIEEVIPERYRGDAEFDTLFD